jgi:DNA-directed RNA polymerase subunit RPC12/RpoP
MPIRVKCDNCKKTLSVKDHLAGKRIKCPVCQSVVAVSSAPPTKAPAPTAAPAPKPTTPAPKPGTAPKLGIATKPPIGKTKTNGTPAGDKSKTNGTPPPEAKPIEVPPVNVEDAAASAFADELKPPVEEEAPKTIDFKCPACDEDVTLPIEMAGKQTQCPHAECRRIIKVPLPKVTQKKDWRKMDRQGPAAARINAPEALENAWGTEEATKARQGSLEQAGAIDRQPPKPRDAAERLGIVFKALVALMALGSLLFGISQLYTSNKKTNDLKDAKRLIEGAEPKVKDPLLAAEVHRTIGLLYLRASVRNPAKDAMYQFQGAAARVEFQPAGKNLAVQEQLFLIDLALSQIELGGDGDDILANTAKKLPWKDVFPEIENTLRKIESPEVRVLALREVGTRLLERKQGELAISLAASLSNAPGAVKRPLAFRQEIALRFIMAGQEKQLQDLAKQPDLESKNDLKDGNARVGYAEGYARKGKDHFDTAFKLAQLPGAAGDRLDACLGVAAVAWQDRNKDEAVKFVKEAVSIIIINDKKTKDPPPTSWQLLQLIKLAARIEDAETLKNAVERLPVGPFKLRAHLEILRALCERSTGTVDAEKLSDLEAADKEGATLALAWMTLAQHNIQHGASRDRMRKDLENRVVSLELPPAMVDQLRAMVDVGSYLGTMR